ncbi:MAG: nucleotidyltransferase domain-containing protein [Ignavibacteriaceae bacterium]|jgi:predicted nucleotidyltransferase|nr:nucleotidyltransferase domain-containing protein [Ignavibacteriaceae bacterium]
MEKNTTTLEEYIRLASEILRKDENILFAYLFGSYVRDEVWFGSDLDIAIYFRSEPELLDIGGICNDLEEALNVKIDLAMLNHLPDKHPELGFNIINEGILLFTKEESTLRNYKHKVLLHYLDVKPLLDIVNRKFNERLNNGRFAK